MTTSATDRLPEIGETHLYMSPCPAGDGHHQSFDQKGFMWEEFDHKDGKYEGRYVRYHSPGKVRIECHYVAGQRQGTFSAWTQWGLQTLECEYKASELTGVYRTLNVRQRMVGYDPSTGLALQSTPTEVPVEPPTNEAGPCVLRTTYFEDGTRKTEGIFREDVPTGVHSEWDQDGSLAFESEYRDGVLLATRCHEYEDNGCRKDSVIVSETKNLPRLRRWSYWSPQGFLMEERETTAPEDVTRSEPLRLLTLNDQQGRNCLLPAEGELTVWKLGKALGPTTEETISADHVVPSAPITEDRQTEKVTTTKTTKTTVTTTVQTVKTPWVYIRLTTPPDAQRVTPIDTEFQFKSRVEFAKVEQIIGLDGVEYKEAVSAVYRGGKTITYKVGEIARPDSFDPAITHECGAGISVHLHQDQCDQWRR